jgi:hypothetical protein
MKILIVGYCNVIYITFDYSSCGYDTLDLFRDSQGIQKGIDEITHTSGNIAWLRIVWHGGFGGIGIGDSTCIGRIYASL